MESPSTFGEWLRQSRTELRLTREQFARRVGVCAAAQQRSRRTTTSSRLRPPALSVVGATDLAVIGFLAATAVPDDSLGYHFHFLSGDFPSFCCSGRHSVHRHRTCLPDLLICVHPSPKPGELSCTM